MQSLEQTDSRGWPLPPKPEPGPNPELTLHSWASNKRKAEDLAAVWRAWWPERSVHIERHPTKVEFADIYWRKIPMGAPCDCQDYWEDHRMERRTRMVYGYSIIASPERDAPGAIRTRTPSRADDLESPVYSVPPPGPSREDTR